MDFVCGGLSGLHLELNQDLFSPFLPPPTSLCLSIPPLNRGESFREIVPAIIIYSATTA